MILQFELNLSKSKLSISSICRKSRLSKSRLSTTSRSIRNCFVDCKTIVVFKKKKRVKFDFELEFESKKKSNIEKFDKFDKIRVYLVEQNDENAKFEKNIHEKNDDVDNYYFSKNLVYYESFSFNDSNENNNIVYFTLFEIIFIFKIFCRKCEKKNSFNNKFNQYIKNKCIITNVIQSIVNLKNILINSSNVVVNSTNIFVTKFILRKKNFVLKLVDTKFLLRKIFSIIKIIKINFIVISNVDYNKNIDIEYKFRD